MEAESGFAGYIKPFGSIPWGRGQRRGHDDPEMMMP
jgi:hypothetical protein